MNDPDLTVVVSAAFRQAGITPSAAELESFVGAYARVRAFLDSLYFLPGVRYESPALTFDPREAYRDE